MTTCGVDMKTASRPQNSLEVCHTASAHWARPRNCECQQTCGCFQTLGGQETRGSRDTFGSRVTIESRESYGSRETFESQETLGSHPAEKRSRSLFSMRYMPGLQNSARRRNSARAFSKFTNFSTELWKKLTNTNASEVAVVNLHPQRRRWGSLQSFFGRPTFRDSTSSAQIEANMGGLPNMKKETQTSIFVDVSKVEMPEAKVESQEHEDKSQSSGSLSQTVLSGPLKCGSQPEFYTRDFCCE